MAKVVWAPGISTISGALSKIDKKSPHAADQQMLLATHRVAPSTNTACNRIYLRGIKSVTRSTQPGADELAARAKFAAVSALVAARKKNAQTLPTDIANFNAQKELPNGKKTLNAYLWAECGTVYDNDGGH